MWRLSEKIGHRVTAYGYRHTYATRALAMGLPDTHVAALLGHGSTRMIHAHYAHLNANARLLKEAAAKVA
jgi:integrase